MSPVTRERWAQIGITIQFLIVVRTLGEFFRLKHVLGTSFSASVAASYIGGALIAVCFCWTGVTLYFFWALQSFRLARVGGHSHSVRLQNCGNWLVMAASIHLKAEENSGMAEITLPDLFDRWERVWHDGKLDLVTECVQPNYIIYDEGGDRTVTREAYAAEIAKARKDRPHLRIVVYDHASRATMRGSALLSSGLTRKPARRPHSHAGLSA
jgi:hypothetical protein